MLDLQHLQREILFIIFELEKKSKREIYISTIISKVKLIYPIGKNSIKKYIQKSLNIKLQKNQKRLYIKNIKHILIQNRRVDERGFIIVEGLYFLFKNRIRRIDKTALYEFYIYNSQLEITKEEFTKYLAQFNIYKKEIYINKRLINKIINRYKIKTDTLYNRSYLYRGDD